MPELGSSSKQVYVYKSGLEVTRGHAFTWSFWHYDFWASSPGKKAILTAFGVSLPLGPRESKGWNTAWTKSLPGRKSWGLEHQCYIMDKYSLSVHQAHFSLWRCYLSCTTHGPLSLFPLLVPLKPGKTVLWALVNTTLNGQNWEGSNGSVCTNMSFLTSPHWENKIEINNFNI